MCSAQDSSVSLKQATLDTTSYFKADYFVSADVEIYYNCDNTVAWLLYAGEALVGFFSYHFENAKVLC